MMRRGIGGGDQKIRLFQQSEVKKQLTIVSTIIENDKDYKT